MGSDIVGHGAKGVMTYTSGCGGCHRVLKKCFTYTVVFMHSSGKSVRHNVGTFLKCNVAVQEYVIA
jgi:hypothetical protein